MASCVKCGKAQNLLVQYIPDPYTGGPCCRSIVCTKHATDDIVYEKEPFNIFYHAKAFGLTNSRYIIESCNFNVTCCACGKVLTPEMRHGYYMDASLKEQRACESCWLADIQKNRL
jgi:hypothetical protein